MVLDQLFFATLYMPVYVAYRPAGERKLVVVLTSLHRCAINYRLTTAAGGVAFPAMHHQYFTFQACYVLRVETILVNRVTCNGWLLVCTLVTHAGLYLRHWGTWHGLCCKVHRQYSCLLHAEEIIQAWQILEYAVILPKHFLDCKPCRSE